MKQVNAAPVVSRVKVVTENAAPLQYLINDKVEGLTTDIVRQIFDKAGIEAEIKIYPWARALQLVKSKPNTFIYSLIRSPDREREFHWVGEIIAFELEFLAIDDPSKPQINKLADAKHIRLGVLRNDYTHNLLINNGFKENEDFQLFSNLPQLLHLLYAKKIDSFIADLRLTQQMANSLGLAPNKLISIHALPNQKVPVYLAANKDSDYSLIQKLQRALKQITQLQDTKQAPIPKSSDE